MKIVDSIRFLIAWIGILLAIWLIKYYRRRRW